MSSTEKPLIVQGWGVRAILDGRKTMTRRVVKPQPVEAGRTGNWMWKGDAIYYETGNSLSWRAGTVSVDAAALCPYGPPGQTLWVRERHWLVELHGRGVGIPWLIYDDEFAPDGSPRPREARPWYRPFVRWGCRPSIHLPREHARLFLRVKSVRVERVQEITSRDAIAEGMFAHEFIDIGTDWLERGFHSTEVCKFHDLWNTLNGKRGFGWEQNPFVWVVEFERIET